MKTTQKYSFVHIAIVFVAVLMLMMMSAARFSAIHSNGFLDELESRLNDFRKERPEDRVYLQTDKPFYAPGEDIWFSAFVRNGSDMRPSLKSELMYVELINPKGNIEKKIKLVARKGRARGDFALDPEVSGGMYKIKAYTKWQENEENKPQFEKEIQVQKVVLPRLKMELDFERKAYGPGEKVEAKLKLNTHENKPLTEHNIQFVASINGKQLLQKEGQTGGFGTAKIVFDLPDHLTTPDGLLNVLIEHNGLTESISRAIPIQLNTVELVFFPEGGDLVNGLPSQVAFSAKNEFGKPADVAGKVIELSTGKTVAQFDSYHHGMGAFQFTPLSDQQYQVQLTRPKGNTQNFVLPEPLPVGFVMNVSPEDGFVHLKVHSPMKEESGILLTVRDKVFHKQAVTLSAGVTEVKIPTGTLPMGVARLTLFDSKGIERAERLVFLNWNKRLKIDISTNKEKYLPREKVQMTVNVSDERGLPMPAQLSLAVVNDQLLTYADDKSGKILSSLLLQPDLNQEIEEAAFYFDKKEGKSQKSLDYLLMTAGWRRFTWKRLVEEDFPTLKNQGEMAILSGQVIDANTREPISSALLNIPGAMEHVAIDHKGRFVVKNIDLCDNTEVHISVEGYHTQNIPLSDFKQDWTIKMVPDPYFGFDEDDIVELAEVMIMEDAAPMRQMNVMAAPKAVQNVPAQQAGGRVLARKENKVKANRALVAPPAPKMEAEAVLNVDPEMDKATKNLAPVDALKQLEPNPDLGLDGATEEIAFFQDLNDKKDRKDLAKKRPAPEMALYRAREFYAPKYEDHQAEAPGGDMRTDFRQTIFWKGDIEVDRSGKTSFEFYNNDEISSFRATAEGVGQDGLLGINSHRFFTQLPFQLTARIPTGVVGEDQLSIPLTLRNNTHHAITGKLEVLSPNGLHLKSKFSSTQTIPPQQQLILHLDYGVLNVRNTGKLEVSFSYQGFRDGIVQEVNVLPKGFPVTLSYAGKEKERKLSFDIRNLVEGSLKVEFAAYPSVVSDLVKGIESILREPNGCFEQTSSSSYPNLMVLEYLKEQEEVDPVIYDRAKDLLKKGYKRLTGFETSQKGFEWFGHSPPHEALTAYGLLQFNDMKNVTDYVDQGMIDRTADWLMSRRDGLGGFKRNNKKIDSFGGADNEITNAYIVWALAEAGYTDIETELVAVTKVANQLKDPYVYGLVTNALFALGNKDKAEKMLLELLSTQNEEGVFNGLKHSITRSTGVSLKVETTSLAVIAMLRSQKVSDKKLEKAVKFIVSQRNGGYFGSTQGTILALKALTQYAQYAKRTPEDGTIAIFAGGKKVAEKDYTAGEQGAIEIPGLEAFLKEGENKLEVRFLEVAQALPYSINISYNTYLPTEDENCTVALSTSFSKKKVKMGETVRMTARLSNISKEGQPSTMVILGIPAGFTAQPWQLKELQEKKIFDFYEINNNKLICYYRQMAPDEIREIHLDLKAEVPGKYDTPASTAYLYYTSEHKFWCASPTITIDKN